MQDRQYLHFPTFDFVNRNVIWVKHVLLRAEDFPSCPDLLGFQNLYLFAKLVREAFSSPRIVFGDVGGNAIKAAKCSVRPA